MKVCEKREPIQFQCFLSHDSKQLRYERMGNFIDMYKNENSVGE